VGHHSFDAPKKSLKRKSWATHLKGKGGKFKNERILGFGCAIMLDKAPTMEEEEKKMENYSSGGEVDKRHPTNWVC